MGCNSSRGAKGHKHGLSSTELSKFEKISFLGKKGNEKLTLYVS